MDMTLIPVLSPRKISKLHSGFVADALRYLSVRITVSGAANLGMEMWEWAHGRYEPSRVGILEIKIGEPSMQ